MSSLVIGGTISIIILMWILTRPDDFKNISAAISNLYTTSVGALVPKG